MLWVLIRIASALHKNIYVVGTQAILMSTHNICFYRELTKIILELSSNTLVICSTDVDHSRQGAHQTVWMCRLTSLTVYTSFSRSCFVLLFVCLC